MTANRFDILPGSPLPLGAVWNGPVLNFALFSRHAETVSLVLEYADGGKPYEAVLDPQVNRTGDIWHAAVDTGGRDVCYGYRIGTPRDSKTTRPDCSEVIAVDPYCRTLLPRAWGTPSAAGSKPICLASRPAFFDWQGDRPLKTPASESIIYELHVRGFTRHLSSGATEPGTFRAVVEKIPYLKELGITAVELLPITEWDETDNHFRHPVSGEKLLNYWGYNPLSFFSLRTGLAVSPAEAANEFKFMVRSLHQAGIEVILDLVFNHTGESDYEKTTSGFRAIDNEVYYLTDGETDEYLNYSGCGNTVNTNHPVVSELIISALRYFVTEYHIDGFRFDLASVFSRDTDGTPIDNAPLIDMIAEDPVLADCKIIAEAWDAAGLYQVGSFSENPRWTEWNGKFRDDVRAFMSGLPGSTKNLATRIAGSSDLYQEEGRSPLNSVNFITSHDGFTLYDMVSYNSKRNEDNGENNRDGDNHNLSWNSGFESSPGSPKVERLRLRRMRTFAALLLFSQGIPMICAGDEWGRSQRGNNNAWCQDNETSWLNWNLMKDNRDLFRFFKRCIALRARHPLFRRTTFFPDVGNPESSGPAEIIWQSLRPNEQDWSETSLHLGFLLSPIAENGPDEPGFLVLVNGSRSETKVFTTPETPDRRPDSAWLHIVDTAADSPQDFVDVEEADQIQPGADISLKPMALVVLQSQSVSAREHQGIRQERT